jgi:signal transduction histidine kinase
MPHRFPFFPFINNSLRAKITLGVTLPLVIVLGIFAIIENNHQQKVILNQLTSSASRSGRVIENSLRHSMLKSDFSEMQTVLNSINDTEDFRVVYLLDTNGEIIFAPNQLGVGNQLENTAPGCITCHRLKPDARPESVIVTAEDGQRVFRSMYPIRNAPECSKCHDPTQKIIGLLLTDIPVAPVEQAMESDFRDNLYWWVGMILLTALIVNFSMNSLVIKRLESLAQALRGFGRGDHNIRLEGGGSDEIGQLSRSFNEMGQRIEMDEIENQRLSNQRGELLKRLITAQEDERKRVARELHDDLGQALSALSLHVQSLERLINSSPDDAIEQLSQISDLIEDTTERMYELILALRPSVLDEFGLVAALRNHAEKFLEGSGITFNLDADDYSGRLSPDLETALYRVFQEALSNVRRHAQAKHVKISLELRDGIFIGEIVDDGKGFDIQALENNRDDPRGLGMMSIRERIAQYCGQVEILSQPGKGTTLSVRLSTSEANCD